MKKLIVRNISLVLSIILLMSLFACAKNDRLDASLPSVPYFHPHSFQLDVDYDFDMGVDFFQHNDLLYFLLLDRGETTGSTYVVLYNISENCTDKQEIYRTSLNTTADSFMIYMFEMHFDGYLSLITRDSAILPPHSREDFLSGVYSLEWDHVYVYRKISPSGEIVSKVEIEAMNSDPRHIFINDAMFNLDGSVVLSVSWHPVDFTQTRGGSQLSADFVLNSFLIFDRGLSEGFREVENATTALYFIRERDEQLIASNELLIGGGVGPALFYNIDIEHANISAGPDSPFDHFSNVFKAPSASDFDFYLLSQSRILGYIESAERYVQLVNLRDFDIGFDDRLSDNSIMFWNDGRITVIVPEWNALINQPEYIIHSLMPIDELWVDEREIITLGGIDAEASPLLEQVMLFNRFSSTHRIEIINYTVTDMTRLRTELMSGQGPDMMKLSWANVDFVEALSEIGFLLDLYTLIDADSVLSRDDFFSSVLSTWENSHGELMQIAPNFTIQTIIGQSTVFPYAPEAWTYADLITFYNNARADGFAHPMGQTLDRLHMLDILLFADDTFFSSRDGVANFDSDSFITVLDFVMSIPADQGWDSVLHLAQAGQWDPISNLINEEQLLIPFRNIHNIDGFRELQFRVGGFTAFGFPSTNAPVHAAQVATGTSVGIRSNSPHIETAWEFIRMSLMPRTLNDRDRSFFPIRVDLYDQLIASELNRDVSTSMLLGGIEVAMPPITQEDAMFLSTLIENIGHKPINEHPVQLLIRENIHAFFSGVQSAEDAARIIQSRVSIYLAESR